MNTKLHVGNLSARVTEESLRFLFSQKGEITEIKLVTERSTGRCRAFALVTMATREGAEAALCGLHRHIWNGRYITVHEAPPKEAPLPSVAASRCSTSPADQAISPFFPIRLKRDAD
ncbi:MAG: RNA-binding protein [Verrucomicrobia subdivision 3 bacterium]|nr:RNA-binding protein [Limisphaerales bacterium]